MKDGADGIANPSNPHDVDNTYFWRQPGEPQAFTDFLPRLNGTLASDAPSGELGGYNDWRLPTSAELLSIRDCNFDRAPGDRRGVADERAAR